MKKILYVTLIEDPINNGILNSQVISVLKGVAKAGHQVTLFSAPSKKLFGKHSKQEVEDYKQKLCDYGIRFSYSPVPVLTNASIRFYLIPWLILFSLPSVCFLALRQKSKILLCRSYPASLIGMLVKMLTGKKFIFDMRGVYPEEGEFLFPNWHRNGLNYKTWKWIEKRTLISADQIVVVSERFKEHVLNEYPAHSESFDKKISVISCGVSPENAARGELNIKSLHDPIRLVYSGTLDGWTTPELLAETYRHVLKNNPQNNFILNIYTTTNQELIHKALSNEGIDSSKYFIQRLKSDEVAEKLRDNDIGILVRVKSIVNEVSFPVKLGEYLAAGLPIVINSALVGAGEFVQEHGIGITLYKDDGALHELLMNYSGYQYRCSKAIEKLSTNVAAYMVLFEKTN